MKISASLLAADLARLGEEAENVIESGADWLHIDVMDNHYVPNLALSPSVIKHLRGYGVSCPFDVHIMASPAESLIDECIKLEAEHITFHRECVNNPIEQIAKIHSHNLKAGIAINPNEKAESFKELAKVVDFLLIMTVYPGFAGQEFIEKAASNLESAKIFKSINPKLKLIVDGGINTDNSSLVKKLGADIIVAGSALFKSENYHQTIESLKGFYSC